MSTRNSDNLADELVVQDKDAAGSLPGEPVNDPEDHTSGDLEVAGQNGGTERSRSMVVPASKELTDLSEVNVLRHELRNSLNIVMNTLSILKKTPDVTAAQDPVVPDLLGMFQQEFETMRHLLSRFNPESGTGSPSLPEEIPEYHDIDLCEVLNAEVKLWRRLLRLHIKIFRFIGTDVNIYGDHCELHEIVHNLFKNAIQAMQSLPEEERKIFVTLREREDYVQVLIQDNGPGIPKQAFAKLFQLGNTSKKGGNGIGLFQAQRLARKIGGDVTLVNNADREDDLAEGSDKRGATAVIELPKILNQTKTL